MIYDPTRTWDIALTNITFANNNGHFLYLKVPLLEGVVTSEILVSEDHIDPLRDADFVIYKLGYVHPVLGGKREASMLWGNVKGGKSAYVYIAYASDAAGTGFTNVFNAALKYIAVKSTTAPIAAPVAADFAGLWCKYVGDNGTNGTNGTNGADGLPGANGSSAYVYIGYASDAAGTGFTNVFDAALDYIAVKATTVAIPAPVVGDFAGLWKNYKGAQGAAGAVPLQITGLNLLSASWSFVSGLYEYNLANANITAAMVVDVIPENADIATVKAADIYPKTVSSSGSVKLYAKNLPTANIGVTIILTIATT